MHKVLTCRENSYSEGNSCATAPTASSATFMQSASDRDTIRGVRQAQSPASVISLHPASSSSNSDCKERKMREENMLFMCASEWLYRRNEIYSCDYRLWKLSTARVNIACLCGATLRYDSLLQKLYPVLISHALIQMYYARGTNT